MAETLTLRNLIRAGAELDDEIELWHGDTQPTDRIHGPDVTVNLGERKRILLSFPRLDVYEEPPEGI